MEAVVDQMVTTGAERLGLALSHPAVSEARQTGRAAVQNGCTVDEAYDYARSVMIQAVTPRDAVEAA